MPKRSMKQDDPLEDFARRDITLDFFIHEAKNRRLHVATPPELALRQAVNG